ncbi:hypothetical protein JOC25_001719 [Solibacillus kalamii]|uniref:Uncharacterized protein n=1 Tax=Solibacillus kalamii TaxID=1748298 RepID=A0ABX3ZLT0_9BACL|nr:hypothetical protein [Solibacillus kalamii]MBM7665260.1 hypothetical protein [Solibacillus kalamii]OUZ40381.1 hypothetical protein CBM15_00560 [Solibacillus kalamii]
MIGLEKSIIYELGTFEAEVYSVEVFNYEDLMISITLKKFTDQQYSADYTIEFEDQIINGATGILSSKVQALFTAEKFIVKTLQRQHGKGAKKEWK